MEELKNNPMSSVQDLSKEVDKIIDYSELRSHLKIQLEEIELLQAIYYRDNEFVISPVILSRVNHFIDEMCHHIPPLIEFTINLKFDDILTEFDVTLPRNYPTVEPIIIVRSNELNRFQQSSLNNDLKLYIESLDRSAVCVCESISWVSDNLSSYRQKDKNLSENVEQTEPENVVFSRYWIYSHHIYSKEKRKEIVSLARRYHITGFCLSGKPGIICIEGLNVNCEEWWQNIKNMTWKKIMCAKKEEIDVAFNSYESQRKFQDFCEISFPNLKSNSRESHTDMGEFFRYLLKHDCGHVFKDYFGFEGKVTNL